jgi:flagellar biogenesis protein FliO
MIGTYVQMVIALVSVILLIFAIGFVLRKKQDRLGLMSVVGYQSLGPKKGVAALKIGKEILILGVTSNDMRLLRVFKDGELELKEVHGFQSRLEKFKKGVVEKSGL